MGDAPNLVAVTSLPGCDGGPAAAAAAGVAIARTRGKDPRGVVFIDGSSDTRRRPTRVSSAAARTLEAELGDVTPAAARGLLCSIAPTEDAWCEVIAACRESAAEAVVAYLPPARWRELVDSGEVDAAVLRADLRTERALTAIAARELIANGLTTCVVGEAPGLVASRRALAGIEPGGPLGTRTSRFARRFMRAEEGQAAPLTLFLALATVIVGVVLAVLGAAATGASRLQRAADLAAVSAARSMRDDHHRLFLPATLPNGVPNPAHLSQPEYEERATAAAQEALARNSVTAPKAAVKFPGGGFAPTRVRIEVRGEPVIAGEESNTEVDVTAVAEAYPPSGSVTAPSAVATGGGYSGPLAMRQGEGMRPDVAEAYDAMAAAARNSGHSLVINSAFRSDTEQAALFAANPDPRMVARPGTSLHRCATELDLGPSSAYGWLAQNATRFGFVQRYPWEAWHYGFTRGPAPCSAGGDQGSVRTGVGGDGTTSQGGLPAFVPQTFRDSIADAATRWNVSANLLAAQLMAESNFNPLAVSPVGASGIAQFMPATAAAYGLRDPLDPDASIDAQAQFMSDLMRQFGDTSLALAAYNAGPAPVAACDCVPPYPENRAYVARILGLMGGVGAIAIPAIEVRLVE